MVGPPRRLAAALTGLGAVLCVLGWYQASGQATVAQQIPYLASATIPGAALLAAGAVALLRPSARADAASDRVRAPALTRQPSGSPGAEAAFLRVPDGRYLHTPDCPLMDGRADAVPLTAAEAAGGVAGVEPGLRSCPLCHAEPPAPAESPASSTPPAPPAPPELPA
ncbi:hypothetical protein KDL01_30505 [Actinospica durhamensis]|uniref:Uncharacterized protein n=1 Tax=Actinospica durhamensis TaxID=1508375 RepID=A0A941EVD3_9ACTN|nr:hypothetical protein [Actinospica durhamensis]MBR7837651.1 hypothetical protein [Actinospica durhamensis]